MKRILTFAVIYLAAMFLGTLVFATLFMFSCNLSSFVTGVESSFFSVHFFVTGVLLSVPLVCIMVHLLFVFYQIRHPAKHILSFIVYVLFGALTWLVVIPTDLKLIARYESDAISPRVEATSAGVFRKEENGIYYYSRVSEKGLADGVFFDTTGYLGKDEVVVPFFDLPVKTESAFPYSDILIKNSLQPPRLVTYPLAVYNSLLTSALYSSSQGFFHWLTFASMGLALLAVYALQFGSSWKLANFTFIIMTGVLILFVNFLYYMNIMPELLKEFAVKLSEFTGAKDPLVILINLIFTTFLTFFGVFMGLYRYGTSNSEIEE